MKEIINNESDLILPYLEIFWEKGIPGVYRQNEPLNDNKSLEEFLKEHI